MTSSTSKATIYDAPKVGSITIYETSTGECIQSCSKISIDVRWYKDDGKKSKLDLASQDLIKDIQLQVKFHIDHACGGSCPAIIPVVVRHVARPSGADAAGWHPISPQEKLLFEVKWAHDHDDEGHHLAMGCVGVRWCTEKGTWNEDGSPQWQTAEFVSSKNVDDTASTSDGHTDSEQRNYTDFDDEDSILGKSIQDPFTIEGQRDGAILLIKRKTDVIRKIGGGDENDFSKGTDMQVGDCVEILRHSDSTCRVFNLRSGATVEVPWKTFLPIAPLEFCECPDGECRCVYVDYEKNLKFGAQNGDGHVVADSPNIHS